MIKLGSIPLLHASETRRFSDDQALVFNTRADEIGVLYFENGKIAGVWCDFNPIEIKPKGFRDGFSV